jgi:hypothetical protein
MTGSGGMCVRDVDAGRNDLGMLSLAFGRRIRAAQYLDLDLDRFRVTLQADEHVPTAIA